jgi:peptidoglycan L-alanyl-D-glutamate endopeptidase CwlK
VVFRLGPTSESHLVGVAPPVVGVVRLAIELTEQDFGVVEGVRGKARQAALKAAGASRTLDSYHLPWTDGLGYAVDLPPWIHDRFQWQTEPGIKVARAMHAASRKLSTPLVWGGVWDRRLADLDPGYLEREISAYAHRWHATHPEPIGHQGYWGPLVDIWHFQGLRP